MAGAVLLLRVLLGFISAFHVLIGAGLMISPRFQAWAVRMYGATVEWTPQMIYMTRILGSFAFVFGLLAASAAVDPPRQQMIIYGFIVLFVVRDLHRLLFNAEIVSAFGLRPGRNVVTNLFFFVQAILLYVLLRLSQ